MKTSCWRLLYKERIFIAIKRNVITVMNFMPLPKHRVLSCGQMDGRTGRQT